MNDFIKARATAIQSQIPGAIFRFASQNPALLEQDFDSTDAFLPITDRIYVSDFPALLNLPDVTDHLDSTPRCEREIGVLRWRQ